MMGYLVIAVFLVLLLLGLSQWANIVRSRFRRDPATS